MSSFKLCIIIYLFRRINMTINVYLTTCMLPVLVILLAWTLTTGYDLEIVWRVMHLNIRYTHFNTFTLIQLKVMTFEYLSVLFWICIIPSIVISTQKISELSCYLVCGKTSNYTTSGVYGRSFIESIKKWNNKIPNSKKNWNQKATYQMTKSKS